MTDKKILLDQTNFKIHPFDTLNVQYLFKETEFDSLENKTPFS